MPTPGPAARNSSEQFSYNQPGFVASDWDNIKATGEVTEIARSNPLWTVNALRNNPELKVFVATGRFDRLNMSRGNVLATPTLPESLSNRITNRCYESGHGVYVDPLQSPSSLATILGSCANGRAAPVSDGTGTVSASKDCSDKPYKST